MRERERERERERVGYPSEAAREEASTRERERENHKGLAEQGSTEEMILLYKLSNMTAIRRQAYDFI